MTFANTASIHPPSRSLQQRSNIWTVDAEVEQDQVGGGHGRGGSGMAAWSVFGEIDRKAPCGMLSGDETLMRSARARRWC
jgi:hypothetical protein